MWGGDTGVLELGSTAKGSVTQGRGNVGQNLMRRSRGPHCSFLGPFERKVATVGFYVILIVRNMKSEYLIKICDVFFSLWNPTTR